MNKTAFTLFILILVSGCLATEEAEEEGIENGPRPVGYIGCSNTMQTVNGYLLVGGEELWDFDENEIHQYDGGAVKDWSDGAGESKFWGIFDQHLEKNPNTTKVWWQLCIRRDEPTPYEGAIKVAESVRARIPGVTIYVSPLPGYTESECEITGTAGIERAKTLAQELDEKNEDIVLGPVLGPMIPSYADKDGCHLTETGMREIGEQMKNFFDGEAEEADAEIEDLTEEQVYSKQLVDSAFEPVHCPSISKRDLPDGYYKGPMIDAHIHIRSLPDGGPGSERDGYNLGDEVKVGHWICMLDYENTSKALVFFPVWKPITQESLDVVKRSMEEYPSRFIPFIMPPDDDGSPDGYPTVDAEELEEMLSVYPGLFKGYGEIGLYERRGDGAPELPPDSQRLMEIYPIIRKHNLTVYFHIGEGQKDAFEKVLSANPDINFIFHGDQLIQCGACDGTLDDVAEILENHPNVYYGVDELYGDVFLLNDDHTKEEFLAHFKDYDPLLEKDLETWKDFIEDHPNQVMWDTDRGVGSVWSIDTEVALTLNNYSRAFIGRLDPEVQERFAYKNAEKLFRS